MNFTDLIKEYMDKKKHIRLIFQTGASAEIYYFEGYITDIHEGFFTFKDTESDDPQEDDEGNPITPARKIHFFDSDYAALWRIEEL